MSPLRAPNDDAVTHNITQSFWWGFWVGIQQTQKKSKLCLHACIHIYIDRWYSTIRYHTIQHDTIRYHTLPYIAWHDITIHYHTIPLQNHHIIAFMEHLDLNLGGGFGFGREQCAAGRFRNWVTWKMNALKCCKRCMPKVFSTKLQQTTTKPPRMDVCNLAVFSFSMFMCHVCFPVFSFLSVQNRFASWLFSFAGPDGWWASWRV